MDATQARRVGDHIELSNGEITLSFDEESWANFITPIKKSYVENPKALKKLRKKGAMDIRKISVTREGKKEDFWIGIVLIPDEETPTSLSFAIRSLSVEYCERCGKKLTPLDKRFDEKGYPSREGNLLFCSRKCWREWYEEYYEFENVWIP